MTERNATTRWLLVLYVAVFWVLAVFLIASNTISNGVKVFPAVEGEVLREPRPVTTAMEEFCAARYPEGSAELNLCLFGTPDSPQMTPSIEMQYDVQDATVKIVLVSAIAIAAASAVLVGSRRNNGSSEAESPLGPSSSTT
jgi:hypothetical protein